MQPNAQRAQRKPHSPVPKPRGMVAHRGRQNGRAHTARAVGDLLRLVARLGVDVRTSANPTAQRAEHMTFISGYLLALETTGLLPPPELVHLKRTCEVLLDGNLTLVDLRAMKKSGNDTDPLYLRAVTLVNRATFAASELLATQLGISEVQSMRLIDRMQADGLVNPPDLFGIRTLNAQPEVRHG